MPEFELLAYIADAAASSPSPSFSLLFLLLLNPNLSKDNYSVYVMFPDGLRNANQLRKKSDQCQPLTDLHQSSHLHRQSSRCNVTMSHLL